MQKLLSDPERTKISREIRRIAACPEEMKGTPTGEVLEALISTEGKMLRPALLIHAARLAAGEDFIRDPLSGISAEDSKETSSETSAENLYKTAAKTYSKASTEDPSKKCPETASVSDRLCMLAAFVELTHMASLVHDDIIDDAKLRRGKISVQHAFGKDAAVYAGDFLISRVQGCAVKEGCYEAATILSEAVESMCIGEIGQARCRYDAGTTIEQYLKNVHGKTAALFQAALKLGALEGRADEHQIRLLEELGEYAGRMFQLRDDLLDFAEGPSSDGCAKENRVIREEASGHTFMSSPVSPENPAYSEGKELHKDFQGGILTMPVLAVLHGDDPDGRNALLPLIEEAKKRKLTAEELQKLNDVILNYGGVAAVRSEIRNCGNYCRTLLSELGSENDPEIRFFRQLIDMLEG